MAFGQTNFKNMRCRKARPAMTRLKVNVKVKRGKTNTSGYAHSDLRRKTEALGGKIRRQREGPNGNCANEGGGNWRRKTLTGHRQKTPWDFATGGPGWEMGKKKIGGKPPDGKTKSSG